MTFNRKAKATSQFYYDLKNESPDEIRQKLKAVVDEYFLWYSTFQNQAPVKEVKMFTCDFLCLNKCNLGGKVQLSAVDLVVAKEVIVKVLQESSKENSIELKLKPL